VGSKLRGADIPQCLHPRFTPDELSLLLRRRGIAGHHYQAAAYDYDVDLERPAARPAACDGCLLVHACRLVPPECLPDRSEDAPHPITINSVELFVEDSLA